jgi:hypothetical protein
MRCSGSRVRVSGSDKGPLQSRSSSTHRRLSVSMSLTWIRRFLNCSTLSSCSPPNALVIASRLAPMVLASCRWVQRVGALRPPSLVTTPSCSMSLREEACHACRYLLAGHRKPRPLLSSTQAASGGGRSRSRPVAHSTKRLRSNNTRPRKPSASISGKGSRITLVAQLHREESPNDHTATRRLACRHRPV